MFWDWIVPVGIGLFVVYGLTLKLQKKTYPELDREADLLFALNDVPGMVRFCRTKKDYLSNDTWNRLLSKIQESRLDKDIYEDLLKTKIDSL